MKAIASARRSLGRMAQLQVLGCAGHLSRRPVTAPRGPVVSLTSFGRRIRLVHLTIESIGRGDLRPSRLILWLDDPDVLARPPAALRRLMRRGLELRLCDDLGPHKKYRPYVESQDHHEKALVTADDDVAYPAGWLRTLMEIHAADPYSVVAHRTRVIQIDGEGLAPYATWPDGAAAPGSPRTIAIGVGGVLYPASFLDELRDGGGEFFVAAPRADDLWLHSRAVLEGRPVVAARAYGHDDMVPLRGTRAGGLLESNVTRGGNDAQAAATYSAWHLERFRVAAENEAKEEATARTGTDTEAKGEANAGEQGTAR